MSILLYAAEVTNWRDCIIRNFRVSAHVTLCGNTMHAQSPGITSIVLRHVAPRITVSDAVNILWKKTRANEQCWLPKIEIKKYSGNFRLCARTPTYTFPFVAQGHVAWVIERKWVQNNGVRDSAVQLYYNKDKTQKTRRAFLEICTFRAITWLYCKKLPFLRTHLIHTIFGKLAKRPGEAREAGTNSSYSFVLSY